MKKEIIIKANNISKEDGLFDTNLEKVKIYKTSYYDQKSLFIYDLCLILVLQGKKIGHLGSNTLTYDCKNYLVVPTTLPLECETYATEEEPFICLIISIDKKVMYEILDLVKRKEIETDNTHSLGIFSDKLTDDIEDLILKLLKTLDSKEESKILGESILRELYYRIVVGENSSFLYKMFLNSNHEAKIANALKNIHDNYSHHLDIPTLARNVDMSVSSFHTYFKKITSHTPLQYIKKIRLNKAHNLLSKLNYQVNDTAYEVGYENVSLFSREFKSYFLYPPKEAKASFRKKN
ncbi:MAG: AraC family transcriptional regulator [Campylobacteraceae bacterium]|nr:AraC family transcriptional regulator [Campylobacteraceae bacterium]